MMSESKGESGKDPYDRERYSSVRANFLEPVLLFETTN